MTHGNPRAREIAALTVMCGCAALYPRYTTALHPPPDTLVEGRALTRPPPEVQRLAVVSAEVPRTTRDARPWDSDGAPDPFVVIYRNDAEVFRSRTLENTFTPEWEPDRDHADLRVLDHDRLRVELREDDTVGSDPIGVAFVRGVPPDAREGGAWVVRLDNGAQVRLRATPPPPQLGMGVTYEFRGDGLEVVAVEFASPARRAGLRPGDRIVTINGRMVQHLGELGAREGMDRASVADVTLGIVRGGGAPLQVAVRRDAVYPAR